MPLPTLPPDWRWTQFELPEDAHKDSIRSILVTWLALSRFGPSKIVGTGFIIGGVPSGQAIVLTAKHVIADGVHRIQRPHSISAPSALTEFIPSGRNDPSIAKEDLRAVWMGFNSADLMIAEHVFFSQSIDIAVSLIRPQDHADIPPLPQLPIDTSFPQIGEQEMLYSCGQLRFDGHNLSEGNVVKFERNIVARTGLVTGVYPDGLNQHMWPCFTTTIPVEPGMSGGFVCRNRLDDRIAACGVVSADLSSDLARRNFLHEGHSIVAAIWPSLALRVPWLVEDKFEQRHLLDLVAAGSLIDLSIGQGPFGIVDLGNGDFGVQRR